jgi:hypothetical protein
MICTWCHANYIQKSTLASAFVAVRKRDVRCLWHELRVTKRLWPEAKRTGDLAPLVAYMNRRIELPHCKGEGGAVLAKDKFKWFGAVKKEIPDFIACEACYEGIILGTAFADRFGPLAQTQGPNDKWECDIPIEFTKRAVLKLSCTPNVDSGWSEFVRSVTHRISLPKCNSQPTMASKLTWYRPRTTTADMSFCETCFLDKLAMTRFAGEFVTIDVNKTIQTKFALRKCNLKPMSISELIWVCNVKPEPYSVLLAGMEVICSSPACFTDDGIKGGRWHNFPNEVGNFGVCEGCYVGIFACDGMGSFFSPQPSTSQQALYCVFNSKIEHYSAFSKRFCEAMYMGTFSIYEDYVRKWSSIRKCAGQGLAMQRAWFGWDDCPICQECYETFVAGTALAESLPLQNTYSDEGKSCFMYSPRMRDMYTAACNSGSADELLAYSRKRQEVYLQTVLKAKMLRDKIQNEMTVANANMQMSANWMSMDSMASAIGEVQTAYWDSSSGYYRSSDAMAGDQAWRKAMAGYDRANDPALWREINALEARWKEVE